MKAPLNPGLEKAVISALSRGLLGLDVVSPDELSKPGRQLYSAITHLTKSAKPPFPIHSIYTVAVEIFGGDTGDIQNYLKNVNKAGVGTEVKEVLRAVRAKQALTDITNEVARQLAEGEFNPQALRKMTEIDLGGDKPRNLADAIKEGWPELKTGLPIKSLTRIGKTSGGLSGMWVVGGEPGLGKSTLAFQIGLDITQTHPVLYYDLDDSQTTFLGRLKTITQGDRDKASKLTRQFYHRDSIRDLEQDTGQINPPALIVIDSIQTLPTRVNFRRSSLDDWIHRLKAVAKLGYSVLLVSEVSRTSYGEARMSGFKESGEIEYACSFGATLLDDEDTGLIGFHVVKNRHGTEKGLVTYLERDNTKQFWFNEVDPHTIERDEEDDEDYEY